MYEQWAVVKRASFIYTRTYYTCIYEYIYICMYISRC